MEQADAVGEADLRRLKRQFSSLKNTFLHYEVKNEFLAGGSAAGGLGKDKSVGAALPAQFVDAHGAVGAQLSPPFPCPPWLAELLDGRPHGDEGELLQHFEAEVDASVAHLRQLKAANEVTQASISEAVQQIAAAQEAFERKRAALAGELTRLAAEMAAHEEGAAERAAAMPDLPDGEAGWGR